MDADAILARLLSEAAAREDEAERLRAALARSERENALLRTAVDQLLLDTKMPRASAAEQRARWQFYHAHKKAIRDEILREHEAAASVASGSSEIGSGAASSVSGVGSSASAASVPWYWIKRRSDAAFDRERALARERDHAAPAAPSGRF